MRRRPEGVARRAGARLGEAAKKLALLTTSLMLVLGVLEVWARWFTDVIPPLGVRHPLVGKTYIPGFRGKVLVDESGKEIELRFNREGFRGPDVPYDKPDGTRRVAVLGDSFVAAIACEEEETAVRQLERLLRASHPETRWEVLNFGVSGASTGQELVLYREVVSRYEPDLVIVAYFTGNDFSDNSTLLSSNPRVYFDLDEAGRLVQRPFSVTRSRLSSWLNRHSRFYVWQKRANDVLFDQTGSGWWIFRTDAEEKVRAVWEINARLLETLRDEVEASGARFLLALYPSAEEIHADAWRELLDRVGESSALLDRDHAQARLADLGRELGIIVVPMVSSFREAAREPGTGPLFFGGRGHFTERGNRLAARLIHRSLSDGPGRELL